MALTRSWIILVVIAGIAGSDAARGDHQPAIVVAGKRGVPVVINGEYATGAIVIGDWGLYRPGHVAPTIIRWQPWIFVPRYHGPSVDVRHDWRRVRPARCRCVKPVRRTRVKPIRRKVIVTSGPRHFFPGGTSPPKLGRHESEADVAPPRPAESFSRTWSTRSSRAPATVGQPPVIVAPAIVDHRFRPKKKPSRPHRGGAAINP